MEVDPASLDPEERTNKYWSLFSAALGILSLCAALMPVCGGSMALLGLVLGYLGMKSEYYRIAIVGVALSGIGLLTAILYAVFLSVVAPLQ